MQPRNALLSVYHKEGIVEFAQALEKRGWNILASGGTAKVLREGGVTVKDVGDMIGQPILGHRVVTLSREIHAGLLARNIPEDNAELERLGIPRIKLVCVDLYPLEEAIASPGATRESVIEMTDVGGPTILHSAAKGERIVIADPADRERVIEWFDAGAPDEQNFIEQLCAKADAIVADYVLAASRYRSGGHFDGMIGKLIQECKYGENAWQAPAALYKKFGSKDGADPLSLGSLKVLEGTAPSYNNFADVDRMLQTVTHIAAAFDVNRKKVPRIALAVKHGNCCGAAVGDDAEKVTKDMIAGDTRAIFGGVVMTNFPIDQKIAEALAHAHMPEVKPGEPAPKRLLDGIAAPSFTEEAKEILARKGGKCRLMELPGLANLSAASMSTERRFRHVRGGFLEQPNYTFVIDLKDSKLERTGMFSKEQEDDLLLAWAVGSTSNSNTVTLVKGGQLIGNGVGQQDRVGCAELALKRAKDAGHNVTDAAAYSDSFFPFPDGPTVLADAGIKTILASSGSVKDADVKKVCEERGTAILMVPDAMGRGFFGH